MYKWDEMTEVQRNALIDGMVFGTPWYKREGLIGMPHYTTDISSAWKVVEKLSYETDFSFKLELHYKGYWTRFGDVESQQCKTAPEAICKTALKAVGVDIE